MFISYSSRRLPRCEKLIALNRFQKACKRYISSDTEVNDVNRSVPTHADIVVCGSGIVGCSVAYLLAKTRLRRVLLVDQQSSLASGGSSAHCSKFFSHAQPRRHEIVFTKLSRMLYQEALEIVPGRDWYGMSLANFDPQHNPKGSFTIAVNQNRAIENRRKKSLLTAADIRSEILDSYELSHYFPSMNCEDIVNALWVPEDILMDATVVQHSLLQAACSLGVQYFPNCRVKHVTTGESNQLIHKVTGVLTSNGYVSTSVFVNCAGPWSSHIGLDAPFPLNVCVGPCFLSSLTTQIFEAREAYPYLFSDPDNGAWIVHDQNRIVIINASTGVSLNQKNMPTEIHRDGFKPCPDHMQRALQATLHRFPQLSQIPIDKVTTVLDSYSYDSNITVGELGTVLNYYVVSGMHGYGLMFGGAAAIILRSLLDRSRSEFNLHFTSPSRYAFTKNNEVCRQARTSEVSVRNLELCETNRDFQFYRTCRGLRVSPIFDILKSKRAIFGCQYGFEWPLFFDRDNNIDLNSLVFSNLYREPHYSESVKYEYLACKQNLGIADMSGFVKVMIECESAANLHAFLERVFCTSINFADMKVSRALALNRLGTYECDVMITRLNAHRYMLVGPCLQTVHLPAWLRRQILKTERLTVTDISSRYGVLNLLGPMSAQFLEVLSGQSTTNEHFRSTMAKILNVDIINDVLTMRVSYTGEDGFTLFVPCEQMPILYNRLIALGKPFGIRNVGYLAIRTLRIEHGIDYWGTEVSQRVTPLECNKGHLVRMDKKQFKGKGAFKDVMSHGMLQRLINFTIKAPNEDFPWPAEGDPIYEGEIVRGYITCSAYSYLQKKHVCLGFLICKDVGQLSNAVVRQKKYEIDICNHRLELCPFS